MPREWIERRRRRGRRRKQGPPDTNVYAATAPKPPTAALVPLSATSADPYDKSVGAGATWPGQPLNLPSMSGIWNLPGEDEPGWSLRRHFGERMPALPHWGEEAIYGAAGGLQEMLGGAPLAPYEETALGSLLGLLEPQPPGGRAYAAIEEGLLPTWRREVGELTDRASADLARRGLTYSGRASEVLGEEIPAMAGERLASTLAPYIAGGEELGAQQQMSALGSLLGLGQMQYGRYFQPYSALGNLLGMTRAGGYAPQGPSGASQWASGIGNLLGGLGAFL